MRCRSDRGAYDGARLDQQLRLLTRLGGSWRELVPGPRTTRRELRWIGWFLAALAGFIWAGPALPLDRDRTISQFQHRSWAPRDGAPTGMVTLAQTSDGFLWIGTEGGGLYRFDGVRFEEYEPRIGRLPSKDITALASTAEGGLWVGFHIGGATFLLHDKAVSYGEPEGLPRATVKKLWLGVDGVPWAATTGGLFRFENGQWVQAGEAWGLPLVKFSSGFVDSRGCIWVTSIDTLFRLPSGTRRFEAVMKVRESSAGPPSSGLFGGAATQDGRIWVYYYDKSELLSLDRDTPARVPVADESAFSVATVKGAHAVLADRDGALWIVTNNGLVHYAEGPDGPVDLFKTEDGLSDNRTVDPLEDQEGNIWVITQKGLDRFSRGRVLPLRLPEDFRGSGTLALASDRDGSLWIGADDVTRPLLHLRGDRLSVSKFSLPAPVTCLYEDSNGVLWIGGNGIFARLTGDRLELLEPPLGPSRSRVPGDIQAMTSDSQGRLWVSVVRHGLYRLQNGDWQLSGDLAGLPLGAAFAAWTDSQGRVWLGYPANRVVMINGEEVHVYTSGDGLTLGDVTAVDGNGSHVWFGGEGGLALFDGATFRELASWPVDHIGGVKGIVAMPDGDLWLSQATGVVHVPASAIAAKLRSPSEPLWHELFNSDDGVLGHPDIRPSPNVVLTKDGRVWLSETFGVSWIDTRDVRKNSVIPSVLIRSLVVDGKTYLPGSPIVLPTSPANLQIDYTALSLTMPERVEYRYRLDAVDHDWRNVGQRRSAYYNNLAPGHYRFQVIASNNDGVWNTTGATVDIEVPPTFFQTRVFATVCVVAGLLGLWLIYQARVRQIVRQLNRSMEERVIERNRIARELHDTLLQSFQGVLLRFRTVQTLLPTRLGEAQRALESAIEQARAAIREGRDAVQGLRSSAVETQDFVETLRALGKELASDPVHARSIALTLNIEGAPRGLQPLVHDEIRQIASEALRNAYRHAEASHIEVQLEYLDAQFELRVRDDGKGVDPEFLKGAGRPGHFGLSGMRERAGEIGGKLSIWSAPGAGTELQLNLPGAIAYGTAESRHRSWLRRRFYPRRPQQRQ